MARQGTPRPTDAELAILQVLWQRGACTVRDVHQHLKQKRSTGYTTTLKLMQIMAGKGLVRRDESQRTHVYRARLGQRRAQRQLVDDLMERAFGGSARKLVMQALSARKVSADELDRIRCLMDTLKRGKSHGGS